MWSVSIASGPGHRHQAGTVRAETRAEAPVAIATAPNIRPPPKRPVDENDGAGTARPDDAAGAY
ncbi:hypothetical protein Aab01nite_39080 [Paractinoplanes abujensis]|nr:hypothetical protein Aab01nite_39080 [Actinoplanes abujensis]